MRAARHRSCAEEAFLALIACPLTMMLIMRGFRGGHGNRMAGDNQAHTQGVADRDAHIVELKHHVASLRVRLAEHDDAAPGGRRY